MRTLPFESTTNWFHDPVKPEQLLSFNSDYIRNLDTPSLESFLSKHPDF